MIVNEKMDHLIDDSPELQPPPQANATQNTANQGNSDVMSLLMNRPKPIQIPGFTGNTPETTQNTAESTKTAEKATQTATGSSTSTPSSSAPITSKDLKQAAEGTAEMWVSTLTMITKQVCSAISGQPGSVYTPEEDDIKSYKKVCASYFAEAGEILSPKMLFMISSLSFFGVMLAAAIGHKRNEKKVKETTKAYKEAKQEYNEAASQGSNDVPEKAEALRVVMNGAPKKRNIFQVDSEDFYTHDTSGNHIKGPKPEKCNDPSIIEIIKKHRRGRKENRLTWGKVNEEVRLHLYGHREPFKNE